MTFLDTSALIKRHVDENGSDVARGIEPPLVISLLALAEGAATVWRKRRAGELDESRARFVAEAINEEIFGARSAERIVVIGLPADLIAAASELAGRHPLSGADAIQLASAMAARDAGRDVEAFASADRRLSRAAAEEGFDLVDGL